MIQNAVYLAPMTISGFGIFAVDEIPGWTDLSGMAKTSIIGFFCLMFALFMFLLFRQLDKQREVAQKDRQVYGEVIRDLRSSWDGWEKSRHADSETLNGTLSSLRENRAGVQATNQQALQMHEDAQQAHDDQLAAGEGRAMAHQDQKIAQEFRAKVAEDLSK